MALLRSVLMMLLMMMMMVVTLLLLLLIALGCDAVLYGGSTSVMITRR